MGQPAADPLRRRPDRPGSGDRLSPLLRQCPPTGPGLRLLTGLNRFTLSHCGSRTPLPTLKPGLTTQAPRLCTGCPLRLCRVRTLTELHYKRRTGAPFNFSIDSRAEALFVPEGIYITAFFTFSGTSHIAFAMMPPPKDPPKRLILTLPAELPAALGALPHEKRLPVQSSGSRP